MKNNRIIYYLVIIFFLVHISCGSGLNGLFTDEDVFDIHNFTLSFVSEFGSAGTGDNQFSRIGSIIQDSSHNIYITDFNNDRIHKYTSAYTYLGWWGYDTVQGVGWHNPGTASSPDANTALDGGMTFPGFISLDANDRVYVPNWQYGGPPHRDDIEIFDSNGGFLAKFGSFGLPGNDSQFYAPGSVEVRNDQYFYIVDNGNHRIKKYSPYPACTLLGWYGKDSVQGLGWHAPGTATSPTSGTENGAFAYLNALEVDSYNYLYVTDHNNNRIQKLYDDDTSITHIATWGTAGTSDLQFNGPQSITLDSHGLLYDCDRSNNRIQVLTSSGEFIGWLGKDSVKPGIWHKPGEANSPISGNGPGEFNWPTMARVLNDGNLYVTDGLNNRVQIFRFD